MNYKEAMGWIKRGFEATTNDGCSAMYDVDNGVWHGSYPEVTGYLSPTLLDGGEDEMARKAARWLLRKQLPNGAMPGGFQESFSPTAFDTGQVLLGWMTLLKREHHSAIQDAADKAAAFLWNALTTDPGPTINIRSVWALKEHGEWDTDELVKVYERRVKENGWPHKADDQRPKEPLSHFIAYVARGFLELGRKDLATKTAEGMADAMRWYAVLPARLDDAWAAVDHAICVPGVAQAAIVFHKLGWDGVYGDAMRFIDKLDAPWASIPTDSEYLPNCHVSWSAKFIADAYQCDMS